MQMILASACVFLMQHYSEEQFINVGSGSEITIRELSELVKRIIGFKGEIVWDESKPDGTPRKLMDSSRLFALGWKPKVNLETGIRMAYEDFLSKQPKIIQLATRPLPDKWSWTSFTSASTISSASALNVVLGSQPSFCLALE
jgi:dTDP-D-glucose 4,6-dehydratase